MDVSKRKDVLFKTKSGHKLTMKEEMFCRKYVELMGNGTQAAIEAKYNCRSNEAFRFQASENLTKPHILERVREILDDQGLNNEIVDAETSFIVKQHKDYNAKTRGIDIYNKIKGRYAPTEHKFKFEKLSDEELEKEIAERVSGIIGDDGGIEEKEK